MLPERRRARLACAQVEADCKCIHLFYKRCQKLRRRLQLDQIRRALNWPLLCSCRFVAPSKHARPHNGRHQLPRDEHPLPVSCLTLWLEVKAERLWRSGAGGQPEDMGPIGLACGPRYAWVASVRATAHEITIDKYYLFGFPLSLSLSILNT